MCQFRYVNSALILLVTFADALVRIEDICGPHNGRRLYVELGEQGILRADNVTMVKNMAQGTDPDDLHPHANSSHDQCSLELVTCPSCVISLTFSSINLHHHCGDPGVTIDSPCRCDYVWISEPPYEDVSGTPFCGSYSPIVYRSNTRTLSIALLYSQSHAHAFTIEYIAERNRRILKGSNTMNEMKSMNDTGAGGVLTSPFFPARYPRDLGMEYIITCPSNSPNCRVRVLFSDFQLAPVSIMEIYDWNGQRLDVSSGARFRPPIVVSSGPSMLVRFYANGGTGLGYKAFYSFVHSRLYDKHVRPITDCGGYVENLGGAITMMDMAGEGVKTYDCVWLIRPPKNFLHMKTHMYLKVIAFAEMGNTELVIKQGPTSALLPLETLRHPVSQLQPPRMREHVAPIISGFHVSLRGSFGPNSRLAIAYAAFNYMDCFTGTDYLCQNHRCISNQLNCDGFDHCGDNSDEPATCMHDWDDGLPDRKWQQNKPNYYFPKIDRYPDLKTATLVFVGSSLGLIILISALIILLYRVGARARQQQELQSRLRTISELLDGARIDEISVTADDPPVYEAPPNYDEVIKLGMEDETSSARGGGGGTSLGGGSTRRKRRRMSRDHRQQRSRSTPSSTCSYEHERQLSENYYAVPSAPEPSHSANPIGTPTMVIPRQQSGNLQLMPDSPPPPYATPTPGTTPRNFGSVDLPGPSRVQQSAIVNQSESSCTDDSSPIEAGISDSSLPHECPAELSRSRFRESTHGSFSRSLPNSRTSSASPPVERNSSLEVTSSLDAANLALGAYHLLLSNGSVGGAARHPGARPDAAPSATLTPPNSSQVCSSFPGTQSTRSNGVSSYTNIESANTCCSPVVLVEEEAQPARPVVAEDVEVGVDPERTLRRPIGSAAAMAGCRCEGACGCASIPLISVDNSGSVSSNVLRLLTGRSTSKISIPGEDNCDSLSTNCSSPCGTFAQSCQRRPVRVSRRPSINSAKVSSISAYSSYERLHDEFDIVSETTSILANTPRNTPRRLGAISPAKCYHSTSDLDNLYESIKAMDSILALKEGHMRVDGRKSRPVTAMLFGSPKKRHCCSHHDYGTARKRSSKESDEDNLP